MSIISVTPGQVGLVGVLPSIAYIQTTDTVATVTTTGYLNKEVANGIQFSLPCIAAVTTKSSPSAVPAVGWYEVQHVGANWSLDAGSNTAIALTNGHIFVGNASNVAADVAMTGDITITNAGVTAIGSGVIVNADINAAAAIAYSKLAALPSAQILVGSVANVPTGVAMSGDATISNTGVLTIAASVTSSAGQTFTNSTASATPGTIRAVKGLEVSSNATVASGNLVGVRGEVDMVGASGGFFYGTQGKVIPTGTLSGSSWTAGVFGQFDISAATVNAGQMAPIWADYGATSGVLTDVTGLRMFAGTNTTAAVLNAMDYRYGKASALFELAGDAGTYITAGAATPGGDLKKIAITIDGVIHYILAAATWS